jgi:hypothetical protein
MKAKYKYKVGDIVINNSNDHFLIIGINSIINNHFYQLQSIEKGDKYSFVIDFVERYYQRI